MKRCSNWRLSLVAITLVLALFAAACGSDADDAADADDATGQDDGSSTSGDDASDSGDDAADGSDGDTEEDDGGDDGDSDATDDSDGDTDGDDAAASGGPVPDTLTIHVDGSMATLNPFLSSGSGRSYLNAVIYKPLLFLDTDSEVAGGVAESWDVSDDGLTITFNLRQDLTWSDGEPFTSDDALWSMQKMLTPDVSLWANRIGGVLGQEEGTFEGLSAPDDYTLIVELAGPNPAWVTILASLGFLIPMMPEHIVGGMSDEELTTTEYWNDEPVTLGAYKFVRWERDQFVELVRDDNWPTSPAFDTVQFKFLQSDVASAQLETGDLHLSTLVAPLEAARLDALDSVTVSTAPGVWPEVLQFADDDPLLQDPRVRQAMIYALDLDALCNEVMQGYCRVTWNQVRLLAPEWAIPTDDIIEYEYNPDRARELLEEAGWDENNKLTMINIGGTDRVRSTEAVVIQAAFAEVGVKLDILSTDVGTLLDASREESERGLWQMFINRGAHFAADPNQVSPYNSCDTFYPNGANLSWYCRPELDELWAQGLEGVTPEERAPIYHEAFRFLNADPDVISLYWPDTIVAKSSALTGIDPVGQPEYVGWNIDQWGWDG